MILFPPSPFDANEWFILIAGAVNLTLVFWLPKRFSPLVMTGIWLFNFYLAQTTDFILGKPPYEFYMFNDKTEYEFFDLLLYILIYPFVAYFALYIYDRWKFTGWRLVSYIILCGLITTGLEWVAVKFHVFTYKGWKLPYSAITYVLVYTLNIMFLSFLQRYVPRQRHQ